MGVRASSVTMWVVMIVMIVMMVTTGAGGEGGDNTTATTNTTTTHTTEYELVVDRSPRRVTGAPPPSPTDPEQQKEAQEVREGGGGGVSVVPPSFTPMTDKNNTVVNITGQLGGSAFLPCTTHHSMERQVSWIRRRDFHILTSGSLTYTKEGRFQVHHPEGSTQWTLAIKYLELDDAGIYECHISTGGGVVAQVVSVEVVEPRAVIPGSGEHHVQAGSTIALSCYVEQSPEPPQYIFWYHNSRMINYDRERGGVNVEIEDVQPVTSHLSLSGASTTDSGNYTCHAANTIAASITVYVTKANQIAAIQPRAMDGAGCQECSVALMGVALVLALLIGPPHHHLH